MKKLLLVLFLHAFHFAFAQKDHVVISQVFGAGGNSSAPFSHDFVELFNPTGTTVSLNGMSLQYSGATTAAWNSNKLDLRGTIEPGKYFLIQLNGGSSGTPLPTPDLTLSGSLNINISATTGKIALVSNTTILAGNCPTGSTIVDFVGFGSADCFERTVAPATSNTTSISRLNNGCTDTDNNGADFRSGAPSPRNSASPANSCAVGRIEVATITPVPFCISPSTNAAGTVAFTANGSFSNTTMAAMLSDASGSFVAPLQVGTTVISGTDVSGTIQVTIPAGLPSGKNYRIRVDAVSPSLTGTNSSTVEIINSAVNVGTFTTAPNADSITLYWTNPAGCFDEIMIVVKEGASITAIPSGKQYAANLNFLGNGSLFDGGKVIYRGTASGQTVTGLTLGKEYYFKAFTRNSEYWSSGFEIKDKTRLMPLPGEIVINQLNPGYGTVTDEYVEIVNTTGKTFDLSELAIRYYASTGTMGIAGGTLTGTLQPHSYWLLASKEAVTVGKTFNLSRDGYIADGFAAGSGQVALIRKTDNAILDAVGYGSINVGNYTEAQATATPANNSGLKRKSEGVDNNNNSQDFVVVANADIDLRNSKSRLANKGATITGGSYNRLYITGNATLSGNINIAEKVVLQEGLFTLGNHTLSTADINEGRAGNYIKTDGAGALTVTNISSALKTFPVGNSTYNPVTITNGSGLSWSVKVADDVAANTGVYAKDKAVQRRWQVQPSGTPTDGATIAFTYNDKDVSQLGTNFKKEEHVQAWAQQGDNWLPAGNAQLPGNASGYKQVQISSWQKGATFVIANVSSTMSALPVKFTQVRVGEQPNGVLVEFTNSIESDVAHYIIERSTNGIDFRPIATLQPKHNNGGAASYSWLDEQRVAGDNYYRIKGVEKDGKATYSNVLKVTISRTIKVLNIFPNPVQGRQLTWASTLPKGHYLIRVTGGSGQHVLSRNFEYSGGHISQTIELPSGVPSGVYLLQVINGNFIQHKTFTVL